MLEPGQDRHRGIVKWFDVKKGYGFVDDVELGDVFIHYNSILMEGFKELSQGDLIEFGVKQTDKGWSAQDIIPVSNTTQFVIPAGAPVQAAALIKQHYPDADELDDLIDQLLVLSGN